MPKALLVLMPLALAASASHADNCTALRDQIEAKIRASGVSNFNLVVVDGGGANVGRVVGSCARGTRNIVYQPGAAADRPAAMSSAPARAPARPVITECKDGSVAADGRCPR